MEKNSELDDQIKHLVSYTTVTLTAGLLFLGLMVANSVNAFSADFDIARPIFGVLAGICAILGIVLTDVGLTSLIGIISTLAAYISADGNIKEKLDLLEKYVKSERNENNKDDEKGKGL